jgi:hypothetical protein
VNYTDIFMIILAILLLIINRQVNKIEDERIKQLEDNYDSWVFINNMNKRLERLESAKSDNKAEVKTIRADGNKN